MSNGKSPQLARSTVATTWRWLWPDVLMRILPLTAVPFIYVLVLHLPLSFLGLTWQNWPTQLLLGLLIGIGMAIFATTYRILVVGPWFRRPTLGDHFLQGFFYLFINGPVEEFFFRGFLLAAVAQWTGWIGWGWLVSTAVYTLYHRLGKWNWRSVAGVGLAGLVFSTLYILPAQPWSLLAVVIVHGFTTWGFLSLGDEVMYQRWKKRQSQ
ncbi:MAG TPA: CPBP family intramembrane glutamic endopeptidase [Ktedonobacteraceae bacterium]|nr:CPBP family intramembrane glutamic endopeptidase [Ktedonobacteraceae bacterium]HVU69877.1 CPBP family intramembrane glutamic endopeptidase [Ktedonobacteraceae bacterium]